MKRRFEPRDVAGVVALAVTYFAGARLGFWLAHIGPAVNAVWPPTGIALAALLLGGYRLWPGIVIGDVASSMAAGFASPSIFLLAAGNTGQALLAVWLLRRFVGFRNDMQRARDVLGLTVAGAFLATMVGATTGVATHMVFAVVPLHRAATLWASWWLLDAISVLLLTPAILTFASWRRSGPASIRRLAEGGALALMLVVITLVVFKGNFHQPYLIAPPLVWAALRFGQRGTTAAIVLISSLGIVMTDAGVGPFAVSTPAANLLSLQAFLGVVAVTAMLLAAVLSERQTANEALGRALAEVEDRVQRRTAELEGANASLRQAQTQWAHFLEASPDVTWIKDAGGRYLTVNDGFLRFWGVRREEVVGATDEVLGSDDVNRVRASDEAAMHDGSFQGEFSEQRSGGEYVFHVKKVGLHDGSGRVVGTLGVARDVTERRRAEHALQQEKEFTDAVMDSLPGVFYVLDGRGRLVRWNRMMETLTGRSATELNGLDPLLLVGARNRSNLTRMIREALEAGQSEAEIKVVDATGEVRVFLLGGRRSTIGDQTYVVGHAADITGRKRMEEHLLQAQKMEAIGNLAGGVAHDFNNLLQAMLSLSHLIRLEGGGAERRLERLNELEDHIKHGSRLTQQLLLFSRQEAVRPELLDLNAAVLEGETLLRRLLRENITLEVVLAAGRLPVEIDRGQLNQVIMNLAVNASDAMPQGGQITLRTAGGGDWVQLSVEDTGHGVPVEIRHRIFEPFFTTKGAGKGTGLGLAVVHGIVTRLGGSVEVSSRAGVGSVFHVKLPHMASAPGGAPGAQPAGTEFERGRGERVLIVEDEPAARNALREILETLGYGVVAVASGEEAGALADRPGFDLLLTDLMLPGISGMELRAGLLDRWPGLGVILMSGYPQDEALRGQVQVGAVHFLQKPFPIAVLAEELRRALADAR